MRRVTRNRVARSIEQRSCTDWVVEVDLEKALAAASVIWLVTEGCPCLRFCWCRATVATSAAACCALFAFRRSRSCKISLQGNQETVVHRWRPAQLETRARVHLHDIQVQYQCLEQSSRTSLGVALKSAEACF